MKLLFCAVPALCLLLAPSASWGAANQSNELDPLRFFAGNTEMVSTTKIIAQKAFVTRSLGRGRISKDGALELVQHVDELGRRQFDRFWHIHQLGPDRFGGTMSEAAGPVTVEKIRDRYRFRFSVKDDLSVEEWLTPEGTSLVRILVTIRKYGIVVAHSAGWIRRTG